MQDMYSCVIARTNNIHVTLVDRMTDKTDVTARTSSLTSPGKFAGQVTSDLMTQCTPEYTQHSPTHEFLSHLSRQPPLGDNCLSTGEAWKANPAFEQTTKSGIKKSATSNNIKLLTNLSAGHKRNIFPATSSETTTEHPDTTEHLHSTLRSSQSDSTLAESDVSSESISSISLATTMADNAFQEGLAQLDANIAKLQQSLRSSRHNSTL